MKKTTFIYSFCGCFLTSAAVAMSLYMNVGENSQCDRYCMVNPGTGQCCPTRSTVSKLNISSGANKVLDGLYINGIKLFDYDGTPRSLSATELELIDEASSGTVPTVTKKQYNQGTQFVVIGDDGEFEITNEPQRGANCDTVKMVLKTCLGYEYCHDGTNPDCSTPTYCKNPQTIGTIYYKQGEGYFSEPGRSNSSRYNDNSFSGGTDLLAPIAPSGMTGQGPNGTVTIYNPVFRGWFTSWFNSSSTNKSSYINRSATPLRSIGHAYIPRNSADLASNKLFLRDPNWIVHTNLSCGTGEYYEMNLYAGWAEGCKEGGCTLLIQNKTPQYNYPDPNGNVGSWLPGAVTYQYSCPTGQIPGTVPFQHGRYTYNLTTSTTGCVDAGVCERGEQMNTYGVCVDMSGNTEYVEGDSGNRQEPAMIQDAPGCWWVYDFDIVFHARPNKPNVGEFAAGTTFENDSDITVSHRYGEGFYRNNTAVTGITTLPTSTNYWLRGYYGQNFNYIAPDNSVLPITDVITNSSTTKGTVWGGRFAVPAGATSMSFGSPNLKVKVCNGSTTNAPTNVSVNVYGGWAHKCDGAHGDCGIQIYTGTSGAYTAGDVKYNHSCDEGYVLGGGDDSNSYYVQCKPSTVTNITYSFDKYKIYNGVGYSDANNCTPVLTGGTCNVGGTITLPTITDSTCGGTSYRFARWLTPDNVAHECGDTVNCSVSVFSGEQANITGILCDCNVTYSGSSHLDSVCATACATVGGRPNLAVGFTVDENVDADSSI